MRFYSSEAKRILNTYVPKLHDKAKKEGLSVNQLINKNVPKDEVLKVRKIEQQASNWKRNYGKSSNSIFIQIPWMKDKQKE